MRQDIKTETLVDYYTKQHLTLRQIAKLTGLSHTGVNKRLKSAGITSEDGERVGKACELCGNQFQVTRSRERATPAKYCSQACYADAITSPDSYIWRHGQRLARLILRQHFHGLPGGHVVHPRGGNDRNNDLSNLCVYESQADHIRAHRCKGSKPVDIWER